MMHVKEGVSLDGLSYAILNALTQMVFWYGEVTVTSGTEAVPGRVTGSLHAVGHAVDVRWDARFEEPYLPGFGPDFDVVAYPGSHLHIEYDPR